MGDENLTTTGRRKKNHLYGKKKKCHKENGMGLEPTSLVTGAHRKEAKST